jgi:glycosyltransferase involved in cell wall biosynthesis
MLFSVLIPAFNTEATVGYAIKSALSQVLQSEVEILVYDDGSSDDTGAVAERCMHDDSRVRVMRAAKNGGASRARNMLLQEARGEWIAFLDSDDVFLPGKLSICLQTAISLDSDFVTHDLGYLRADGRVVGRIKNIDGAFTQASIVRRELISDLRFCETLSAGEDSQFFCLLKRRAKRIHLPSVLTGIRIRRDSLTDKFWFQKRLIELWHETHKDLPPPDHIDGYMEFYYSLSRSERINYLRKWLGQKFGRSAAGAMLAGNRLIAARDLIGSLLLSPSYFVSRVSRQKL